MDQLYKPAIWTGWPCSWHENLRQNILKTFIWNHTNRIPRIWNLSFTILVRSDILLFVGIYWLVFVIFTGVHLYQFLNYELKAKSGMDEWREKNWQNSELTKPRLIKADWLMTFPWLINKKIDFRSNMSNVFISGKDDLVKHQWSADHWQFYQNGKDYYSIYHRYRHYLCASKFIA